MDTLRIIAAYALPVLTALAAGAWNPLPPGVAHDLVVPIAAGLASFFSLLVHPNGVNGPAKMSKKADEPPVKMVPPAVVLLLGGLLFAAPARAQDTPPASGPLAVQLNKDFSLHLNVTVPAFGYSLTQKKFLGQVTFGLAYVLDWREKVAVGAGGGFVQTNDAPGANIQAMLGGPMLPYMLGSMTKLRPAVLYQYKWLGGLHEQIVAGTVSLQF